MKSIFATAIAISLVSSLPANAKELWNFHTAENQEAVEAFRKLETSEPVTFRDRSTDLRSLQSIGVKIALVGESVGSAQSINDLAESLFAAAGLDQKSTALAIEMKRQSDKTLSATFTIDSPIKNFQTLLAYDVPELKQLQLKSLEIASIEAAEAANLTRQAADSIFTALKPQVYDAFVNSPKTLPNLQELAAAIKPQLGSLYPAEELSKLFNNGVDFTEDQRIAIVNTLASGIVTYGFQWGGSSMPMELEKAKDLFYRILKINQSPINLRDTGLLRLNQYSECRTDEREIKLADRDRIEAPSDNFCAKLETNRGPSDSFYGTASFYFLQAQRDIQSFETADGKKLSYIRDKQSDEFDPVYKLTEL